jgi:hypothetical protein
MADELSDQVRLLLQGGIQNCLHSFKDASMHEKEDLNTLLAFYRAMHAMTLSAIKIERKLNDSLRKTDGLFREFGAGTPNRLPETAAGETKDVQFVGGNANGTGLEGTEGSPEQAQQSGITYFILHFD